MQAEASENGDRGNDVDDDDDDNDVTNLLKYQSKVIFSISRQDCHINAEYYFVCGFTVFRKCELVGRL